MRSSLDLFMWVVTENKIKDDPLGAAPCECETAAYLPRSILLILSVSPCNPFGKQPAPPPWIENYRPIFFLGGTCCKSWIVSGAGGGNGPGQVCCRGSSVSPVTVYRQLEGDRRIVTGKSPTVHWSHRSWAGQHGPMGEQGWEARTNQMTWDWHRTLRSHNYTWADPAAAQSGAAPSSARVVTILTLSCCLTLELKTSPGIHKSHKRRILSE